MTATINNPNNQSVLAVVINLDRSPDRLNWFMSNAINAHLNIEKIAAVDAGDDKNKSLISTYRAVNAELSDGEMACILSHRLAWEMLVKSKHTHIAIFEDDVYLSSKTSHLLADEKNLNGYDLIKLETLFEKVSLSEKIKKDVCNVRLSLMLTRHYGAAGYIVSRECAKKLLMLTRSCDEPVDYVLFDEKSALWQDFEVYQAEPAMCVQDQFYSRVMNLKENFKSDIGQVRKPKRSKKKRKFFSSSRLRKFIRYLSCVKKGAPIFRYKKVIQYLP